MPDRVISVPQATQIAQRIKNKFDNVNGRLPCYPLAVNVTDGSYVVGSTGGIDTNANLSYAEVSVLAFRGKGITIQSYLWEGAGFAFLDVNGAYIYGESANTKGITPEAGVLTKVETSVPYNAYSLRVTLHQHTYAANANRYFFTIGENKATKVVFIGDSYGTGYNTGGSTTGWVPGAASALGLKSSDFEKQAKGGAGFRHPANTSPNETFTDLLNTATLAKEDVGRIIVCGGYNDHIYTVSQLLESFGTFATKAREKYPFAEICVGMVGHTGDASVQETIMNTTRQAYMQMANVPGVRYLSNVECTLTDENVASDQVHPNQAGATALGTAVGNAVKTGSTSGKVYDSEIADINGRLGELNSDLINDDNFYEDRTQTGEYKLTWTNGKYINTSGGVGSNNSCSATLDFIPIRSGDVLSIYCHAPGSIDVVAIYDENKTLVEQFTHVKTAGALTYNVASDGFIRMSNEPGQLANSSCFLKVTNLGNVNSLGTRLTSVETGLENANDAMTEIKNLIPYPFDLAWTSGKYIISTTGTVGNASTMACTTEYYPVIAGQKLAINLYANGSNECAVAFYDANKVYDSASYVTSDGESIVTVPFDGFARFSTKVTYVSTTDAYVKNYVSSGDDEQAGFANKKYYIKDFDQFITGEAVKEFTASSPRIDGTYKGEVNSGKRYLAIGFDDFRASDYSMIIPLFEKYGGRATFNRPITSNDDLTKTARNYLDSVIFGNHEVGDHTIKHMAFPYEDALFNGQNPSSPDGSQTPYPTNDQMRGTEGSTVNAFYLSVNKKVNYYGFINGLDPTIANTNWEDLTDAQCQTIRETFSALKNPTLAPILDELSNYYLGTTGASAGSWDSGTGKYTGGIFTGCATSANHEIWERILTIVQMYYKEKCGLNGDIQCWSWPGEYYFGRGFSSDGHNKYYRADMTLLYNMNARFTSSLYVDELGNAKVRSFTDVLREFGYKYTHDYIFPGRMDYQAVPAMRKQFYFNEHLSKEDGVLYPTDRTVTYSAVNTSYPSTFFTTGKTKAAQMYDGGGVFYNFIEALRHDTAHGLIHGEVIDSTDSYSMKVFFEEALRFCKSAGIEVITKAEAYDICFNHPVMNGNLIYNPMLRNTAKEYFTDATNVPTNPDGYAGDCSVTEDASGNILVTTGETTYIHYGVPLGKIKYTTDAKGNGTITIYLIKCGSAEALTNLEQLASISVSESDFTEKSVTAVVPNNPMATWTPKLEGRDNKVMGLKIVYSAGLQVKNINLVKMT